MMTGNLGAQSFFPPGKVADYWGFQYLRDNDADNMGHNTDFLTRVSCNMLYILNDPHSPRFDVDRMPDGRKTKFGTLMRNLEAEKAALEAGADIVNDVSAFRFDPQMAGVVSKRGAAVILMHMKGTPETMQIDPKYEDMFYEISWFLKDRIEEASSAGIGRERIIVDPGIGFGKTVTHNLLLIKTLQKDIDTQSGPLA
jgi:hypothetical protein